MSSGALASLERDAHHAAAVTEGLGVRPDTAPSEPRADGPGTIHETVDEIVGARGPRDVLLEHELKPGLLSLTNPGHRLGPRPDPEGLDPVRGAQGERVPRLEERIAKGTVPERPNIIGGSDADRPRMRQPQACQCVREPALVQADVETLSRREARRKPRREGRLETRHGRDPRVRAGYEHHRLDRKARQKPSQRFGRGIISTLTAQSTVPAAVRDIARARPDGELRYAIPGKGPDNPECRVVAATQDQGWRPRSRLRSRLSRCHYRLPRAGLSSVEDDEGKPEDVARTPPGWVTRGAQHGLKVGLARYVVKRLWVGTRRRDRAGACARLGRRGAP
jgi:hypothetical protein